MLRRTLVRTLWSVYDALGSLVIANVFWVLLTLPWLAFFLFVQRPARPPFSIIAVASVVPIVFLNPASAGVAEMAQRLVDTGDTELRAFWIGFRAQFYRATLLMSVGVFVTMVLGASVVFYGQGVLGALGTFGNVALAGLTVWVGLIVAGMGCYWMPVAVGVQGKSPRVLFILKRSALLTLDNALFTLGVLVFTALISAFWTITVVGPLLIGMSVVRVFHAQARRALWEKYAALERLAANGARPTKRQLREALRKSWAQEPARSLRDLLKPWQS